MAAPAPAPAPGVRPGSTLRCYARLPTARGRSRRRRCTQVPQTLDAPAVRTWCALALEALGRAREEIDAINVYPVADGDTGTNLYLTVESAAAAVEAVFAAHETGAGDRAHARRRRAGDGARGADRRPRQLRHDPGPAAAGHGARCSPPTARRRTPTAGCGWRCGGPPSSAREAVAHPVEGTILTVASAAADAAARDARATAATVARAAYEGARGRTGARPPGSSPSWQRAGVVDAGGRGLVAVLGGAGRDARRGRRRRGGAPSSGAHARADAAAVRRRRDCAADRAPTAGPPSR